MDDETTEQRLPPTVGEVLLKDFMEPLGLTVDVLAARTHIPRRSLLGVINGEQLMPPYHALLLSAYFGTSPELWLNLQARHELAATRLGIEQELRAIAPHPTNEQGELIPDA